MIVTTRPEWATADLEGREASLIDAAWTAVDWLRCDAAAIDEGSLPLRGVLDRLASVGLCGACVPEVRGGGGVSRVGHLRLLEAISAGDGTTAFVLAQHYGAASLIGGSPHEALKGLLLPQMASGETLVGFGISQLRRMDTPLVAERVGDGYIFNGSIPWMTGYGILDRVVIGGALNGDLSVLASLPFALSPHLRIQEPQPLIAMSAARTVSASCSSLYVPQADIVLTEPRARRGGANATMAPCLYGLTLACLDELRSIGSAKADMYAATENLEVRLLREREAFYRYIADASPEIGEDTLGALRARALRLASETVSCLILAAGGRAHGSHHLAQRRWREVAVFSTWGASPASTGAALRLLSTSVDEVT